ncbi:nucleotide-binding protein [Amycolatopsis sp. NBC_01307]|uniref:CATRA conflict system CASPASE/TPR repeat-associated protein n=1 Tax=Amycolatopsis sp. NBC_01307 TaxID=2903561 RepID=UPI002E10D967|nr:nucleotide-binding protein [Amycolatopsis sp. NBC_01307]
MPPVVDQEFVAHLFAFEGGPRADRAYEQLRALWTACGDQLGMSVPIDGLGVPDHLPENKGELRPGDYLAARQRAGNPDRQCVLRRVGGGVLALSVMMVQPRPERTGVLRRRGNGARLGWADFALLWSRATAGGTDALLDETVLLLARTQTKRNPSAKATEQLGRSLGDLLPHDETRDLEWWHAGSTTASGLGVWDVRRRDPRARELVVVASPAGDRELSEWVWLKPGALLPPLAEYLLEAAVVRHHARVLESWQAAPRLTDLDRLVAEISATFGGKQESGARSALLRSHLDRLQENELHLGTLIERLQRVVDETDAGVRRMEDTWGDPGSVLPNDRSLATWLRGEVMAELAQHRNRLTRVMHTRRVVADELDRASRATDGTRAVVAEPAPEDPSRKVFVIHGRDNQVRKTFFSFFQALDLRPQDFELLVTATGGTSPNTVDVVRRAPEIAQAIVVLVTPDDTVVLHPDLAREQDPDFETAVGSQARPNVLVELGMALMAYPDRTIIIEMGSLRPISDLSGLHVVRFDGSGPAIARVVSRLKTAGCPVDESDRSWKDPARFADLAAFTRRPRELR